VVEAGVTADLDAVESRSYLSKRPSHKPAKEKDQTEE
jgi:hypothetical protein